MMVVIICDCMDSQTRKLLQEKIGKDVTRLIAETYMGVPTFDELVLQFGINDTVKIKKTNNYIDDVVQLMYDIFPTITHISTFNDGNVAYHGRECDWYELHIYKLDDFMVVFEFENEEDGDIGATRLHNEISHYITIYTVDCFNCNWEWFCSGPNGYNPLDSVMFLTGLTRIVKREKILKYINDKLVYI